MTVYELIRELTEFPSDATVYMFKEDRTEVEGVADRCGELVLTDWKCCEIWEG